MRVKSLLRRRPSASLIVSTIALFVALGGASYAAFSLPPGSVGTAQLRNASVTNWKILNGSVGNFKLAWGAVGPRKMENGAVGTAQINSSQVQARVNGTCLNVGQAIGSISQTGGATCQTTLPKEFGTAVPSSAAVALTGGTPKTVATLSLPAGSPYLVLANAHVVATATSANAGNQVTTQCTLAVPGTPAASITGELTVHVPALTPNVQESGSIPLSLPATVGSSGATGTLSCTTTGTNASGTAVTPAVNVDGTVNAIQTASNS